jgi:hypothetical protein
MNILILIILINLSPEPVFINPGIDSARLGINFLDSLKGLQMWVKQGFCTEQKQPIIGSVCLCLQTRETREGWPLLTVETEANRDSWSTYERVLPWLVRLACHVDRFFVLGSPVQNIIFLTANFFTLLGSPSPSNQGTVGSTVVLGRLSLCLSYKNSYSQAKVFRHTEQDCSLSSSYETLCSVKGILRRLSCMSSSRY